MPHWLRKHMGEIASVTQRCAKEFSLSPSQRQSLQEARDIADRLSIGAHGLGQEGAGQVVALLCAVCS
ncbi:MAG: hypothetical protein N2690_06820, partial [Rhodocyclaceae bacterium]|nr:hypothetical protein [Rhodocyclaceae bacterium]